MRNINFNNKETYLTYRSVWKAEYKQLSQEIRDQKTYIRSQHTPSSEDYGTLLYMKEKATCMIGEMKASKEEAQRQYLKAKSQQETIAI